jgi:hypothetical protein
LGKFPRQKFSDCTILLGLTGRPSAIRFVLTFTTNFVGRKHPSIANPATKTSTLPPPKGGYPVKKTMTGWKTYRTRFLVRAHQLNQALSFTDVLGREHRGRAGDYLVESSDATRSIAPREIFEDVYVEMEAAEPLATPGTGKKPPGKGRVCGSTLKRRPSSRAACA